MHGVSRAILHGVLGLGSCLCCVFTVPVPDVCGMDVLRGGHGRRTVSGLVALLWLCPPSTWLFSVSLVLLNMF